MNSDANDTVPSKYQEESIEALLERTRNGAITLPQQPQSFSPSKGQQSNLMTPTTIMDQSRDPRRAAVEASGDPVENAADISSGSGSASATGVNAPTSSSSSGGIARVPQALNPRDPRLQRLPSHMTVSGSEEGEVVHAVRVAPAAPVTSAPALATMSGEAASSTPAQNMLSTPTEQVQGQFQLLPKPQVPVTEPQQPTQTQPQHPPPRDTEIRAALSNLITYVTLHTNLTTELDLQRRHLAQADSDVEKATRRIGTSPATPATTNSAGSAASRQYPSIVAHAKAIQSRTREKVEKLSRELEKANIRGEEVLRNLTILFGKAIEGGGVMISPPSTEPSSSSMVLPRPPADEDAGVSMKLEKEFKEYKASMEERFNALERTLISRQESQQQARAKQENERYKKLEEINRDVNNLWDRRGKMDDAFLDFKTDTKREYLKVQDRLKDVDRVIVRVQEKQEDGEDHWRDLERKSKEEFSTLRAQIININKRLNQLDSRMSQRNDSPSSGSSSPAALKNQLRLCEGKLESKFDRLNNTVKALQRNLGMLEDGTPRSTSTENAPTSKATLTVPPASEVPAEPSEQTSTSNDAVMSLQANIGDIEVRLQTLQGSIQQRENVVASSLDQVSTRVDELKKALDALKGEMQDVSTGLKGIKDDREKDKEQERVAWQRMQTREVQGGAQQTEAQAPSTTQPAEQAQPTLSSRQSISTRPASSAVTTQSGPAPPQGQTQYAPVPDAIQRSIATSQGVPATIQSTAPTQVGMPMSAQTAPPPQQSGVVQYPPPQPVTTAPMQGMPVRPAMRNPQMMGPPQSQPPPQAGNQFPPNYAQQPVPMVPVPGRPNMLMPANAIPPTQGIPPTTNYPSRQQPMQVDMAEPTSALSAGGSPGQGLKSADIQTRLTRLEKTLEMLQHAHRNLTMRCDNLNSEPIVRAMSDKLLDSFPHARQAEKEIKNAWGEIGSLKQKMNDMGLKQGEIQKAVEALTSKGVRGNGDAMELSRGERRAAGLGLAGEEAEEVWNEMQLERDRLNNEIGLANSGVDEVRLKMETEFGEVRELRGVVKKVEDGLEGVRGEVKVLWQEVGDLQKGAKRPAAAAALDSGVTATGLNGRKRPRTDAVATEGDEVLEGEQP